MDTVCKSATIGILLAVFIGLVAIAGCVDIVEYLGAMLIAALAARLFFTGVCGHGRDQLAQPR